MECRGEKGVGLSLNSGDICESLSVKIHSLIYSKISIDDSGKRV